MRAPVNGSLDSAQRLQANLFADVRRLSELNDALVHYWQVTRLPSTMQCHYAGGMCEDCRASDKVRRLLRQR